MLPIILKKGSEKEQAAQHREKLFDYYTKAANLGHATAWRRIGSHLYWENGDLKLYDECQRKQMILKNKIVVVGIHVQQKLLKPLIAGLSI